MMRRPYIRSYGAFGAQSHYRIKPTATPRIGSDVRKAGRWGLSLETQQPLSPRLSRSYQSGALPFQVRFQPRPVSMKGGMAVGQGSQFVEHHGDIARHADLVGLGVAGFGPRF